MANDEHHMFESATDKKLSKKVRSSIIKENEANTYRDLLFAEAVLLKRFFKKRKNKYRSDKGFLTMLKIIKAVERVHEIDIKSAVSLLRLNLVDYFVPSQQLCHWIMVKLQSNIKLLHRSIECCEYAASMLRHRLSTGHSWVEILLAFSIVSRIWSLSRYLMENSCNSYQSLHAAVEHVPVNPREKPWVRSSYTFPDDIKKWVTEKRLLFQNEETDGLELKDMDINKNVKPCLLKFKKLVQLKKFLKREDLCRINRTSCLNIFATKNMDALQWNMLRKQILKWIKVLKGLDKLERTRRLKRISKKLNGWLSESC